MTKVTKLNPGGRPWENNSRCQAKVADFTAHWRMRNNQDDICTMVARYQVGDHQFCERHAGRAVLAIALKAGRIK